MPLGTSLLATLCVILTITPRVAAQTTPTVDLDEALRLFAENNLELLVARSRVEQVEGLSLQAGAFPNPTLSATHEPLSGASRSYSETYLTASQRFELPGARGARSAAAARRTDVATFAYRADSLRLAFGVKRVYTEALLAQEREAVSRRVAEVFGEAAERARERYEDGDISRFTLRRIEVERARYETLLAGAEIEMGSAQRALALLVDPAGEQARLAAAGLPANIPPSPAAAALGPAALERRPELAAARAEVEAEVAQARLIRAERVPDLTATGGLKRQSDGLRGAFLGLSLPVPVFDRGAGAVEAADAGRRAAVVVTQWNDSTELFLEYPQLSPARRRATGRSTSADMKDFKPIRTGTLTVRFMTDGGAPQTFTSSRRRRATASSCSTP
jgi:outer membrane protein, heavy metal efflux system